VQHQTVSYCVHSDFWATLTGSETVIAPGQVPGVRVPAKLPVAFIVRIAGEFYLFNPLDPLVSPFILGNQLEGESPFCGKGDIVHRVCHDDIVVHDIAERERRRVSVVGMEDNGVRPRVNTCFPNEIADEHAFPEERDIPALNAVKRDNLGVMPVVVENFTVRQYLCRPRESGNREPVIGGVDMLRTGNGVLVEVIDGREIFSLIGSDLDSGKLPRLV
jgi:hypothetical protein